MGRGFLGLLAALLGCAACKGPVVSPLPTAGAGPQSKQAEPAKPLTQAQRDAQVIANLEKLRPPRIEFYPIRGENKVDLAHDTVTLPYDIRFVSRSSSQIVEIDVALTVTSYSSKKELYRSPIQKAFQFHNARLPHFGTLEAFSQTSAPNHFEFTIPTSLWTLDTIMAPKITYARVAKNESDLHDFGNLISYMEWHSDPDIEATFLTDPSLFKARSSVGLNAAMLAASEGGPELLDFMVAHGADLHAKTDEGCDVFYAALGQNDPEMLDHVVKLGLSPNQRYGKLKNTAIMVCIDGGLQKSAKWLIDHGADPNAKNAAGWTPMIYCVNTPLQGSFIIEPLLVKAKADLHCRLPNGYGLMHLAYLNPTQEQMLFDWGVSVNDRAPVTGVTPAMAFARVGYYSSVKWLVDHGADLKAKDAKWQTVFDYVKNSNPQHTDYYLRQALGMGGGW